MVVALVLVLAFCVFIFNALSTHNQETAYKKSQQRWAEERERDRKKQEDFESHKEEYMKQIIDYAVTHSSTSEKTFRISEISRNVVPNLSGTGDISRLLKIMRQRHLISDFIPGGYYIIKRPYMTEEEAEKFWHEEREREKRAWLEKREREEKAQLEQELQEQEQQKLIQEVMTTGVNAVDKMEGHQFENYCAGLLYKLNFSNIEVTKGSGDQGVDIIAEKDGVRYAIQCKCYSSALGNTPIQEVNAGKQFYHCHVAVVLTNQYFTSGAKALAAATGVLLWDRDELEKMILKAEKNT